MKTSKRNSNIEECTICCSAQFSPWASTTVSWALIKHWEKGKVDVILCMHNSPPLLQCFMDVHMHSCPKVSCFLRRLWSVSVIVHSAHTHPLLQSSSSYYHHGHLAQEAILLYTRHNACQALSNDYNPQDALHLGRCHPGIRQLRLGEREVKTHMKEQKGCMVALAVTFPLVRHKHHHHNNDTS